jgi:copper resistance protein B
MNRRAMSTASIVMIPERPVASFLLACALPLWATASLAQQAHEHAHHQSHAPEHANHGDHSAHEAHARSHAVEHASSPHVPPDPPQRVLGEMSHERMMELMSMDDAAAYSLVAIDRFEWRDEDGSDALAWDAYAYYGDDYDKAWLKYEGMHVAGAHDASAELLWDRIFSRWWSTQLGVRHDFSSGPSRTWLAFGLQGLAPYWFEISATAYIGEQGRTAVSLEAERDVLLTQRLILQPAVELNAYGKDDFVNRVGAGLSSFEASLRLRYEIRREIAPYAGVTWQRLFGESADFARSAGADDSEVQAVAGVRVWF